jgi:hypothetical protein
MGHRLPRMTHTSDFSSARTAAFVINNIDIALACFVIIPALAPELLCAASVKLFTHVFHFAFGTCSSRISGTDCWMRAERLCNRLSRADAHPHADTVGGAHPSLWSNHYPVGNRSSGFDHHAVLRNGNRDRHKRRCWRHHLLGATATPGGRGRLSGSSHLDRHTFGWRPVLERSRGFLRRYALPKRIAYLPRRQRHRSIHSRRHRRNQRDRPDQRRLGIGGVYADLHRRPRAIDSLRRCCRVSGRSIRFVAGREVEAAHFGNG